MHFYDTGLKPDRAQLGIGEGDWPGGIFTIVVWSRGRTMVLGPSRAAADLARWHDGRRCRRCRRCAGADESFNHWHAWVDKALDKDTPHLWAPFAYGLRCTEAGLLAVKAAKYPGQVLEWDRSTLTFPNHADATRTIVRREYRAGFEPVRLQT